jgi:hypothetical protein
MPSQVTRYRSNEPITYEALSAILPAGKLVAPQNAPATSDASLQGISVNTVDAAQNILGYTTKDAVPISLQLTYMNGTMGYDAGYPFADASTPTPQVAVAHSGVTLMAYTGAACAYGDRLAANATGGVRKWVTADLAQAIVGWCAQPGGVGAPGAALARTNV